MVTRASRVIGQKTDREKILVSFAKILACTGYHYEITTDDIFDRRVFHPMTLLLFRGQIKEVDLEYNTPPSANIGHNVISRGANFRLKGKF